MKRRVVEKKGESTPRDTLGPPSRCPFSPNFFGWEGSPTKIHVLKKLVPTYSNLSACCVSFVCLEGTVVLFCGTLLDLNSRWKDKLDGNDISGGRVGEEPDTGSIGIPGRMTEYLAIYFVELDSREMRRAATVTHIELKLSWHYGSYNQIYVTMNL